MIARYDQEANFQLDLPNDFDEDSSDDDSIVTVVSPREGVRKVQDDSNVYTDGSVKKLPEYPDLEVTNIVKNIKAAKETENIVQGLVSNSTDFRSANEAILLCYTMCVTVILCYCIEVCDIV